MLIFAEKRMSFIREISALETFPVRHPVLRKGKPVSSCHFDGDDFISTKHFGIYNEQILAGVISLFKSQNVMFKELKQFQIRGMAVLEIFQQKGYGQALIQHVEISLKKENEHIIWLNSRKIAVEFYQKLGYNIIGDPFEINQIGTHYLMYKKFE